MYKTSKSTTDIFTLPTVTQNLCFNRNALISFSLPRKQKWHRRLKTLNGVELYRIWKGARETEEERGSGKVVVRRAEGPKSKHSAWNEIIELFAVSTTVFPRQNLCPCTNEGEVHSRINPYHFPIPVYIFYTVCICTQIHVYPGYIWMKKRERKINQFICVCGFFQSYLFLCFSESICQAFNWFRGGIVQLFNYSIGTTN